DAVLSDLAARVSPRVIEAPARLDDVRRQLDEYFAGRRHAFDLAIDWELTHGFTRRVLQSTARIPFGELGTYRSVATRAGNAAAVRAAGNALGANPMPIVVPCHRIVRTGGALGGYTGGVQRKEFLLTLEGTLPRSARPRAAPRSPPRTSRPAPRGRAWRRSRRSGRCRRRR